MGKAGLERGEMYTWCMCREKKRLHSASDFLFDFDQDGTRHAPPPTCVSNTVEVHFNFSCHIVKKERGLVQN